MAMSSEETALICQRMASALVEATPEWWNSASLELMPSSDGFGKGLSHTISNEEFPRDTVVATDELFEAKRALELASIQHGDAWKRCLFRIELFDGTWQYVIEFDR